MKSADRPPIPKYRCHKEVWALKIKSVEQLAGDDSGRLVCIEFEQAGFEPRSVSLHGKPTPEPGWYYVIYRDGYSSFSPEKEFEEGYTRITP